MSVHVIHPLNSDHGYPHELLIHPFPFCVFLWREGAFLGTAVVISYDNTMQLV